MFIGDSDKPDGSVFLSLSQYPPQTSIVTLLVLRKLLCNCLLYKLPIPQNSYITVEQPFQKSITLQAFQEWKRN